MRQLLIAGLLLVTAACGAYSFPAGNPPQTGSVHGTVRVYPCAPVEQEGQVCNGLRGTGMTIQFNNGSQTSSTTIDSTGSYSITLPAGTWKVTFQGIARIVEGPNPLTVPAGGSVEADYQVDSGIRLPAPASATS